MPKSKRDKKISLTKTSKKGLLLKQQIIDEIRRCVDEYQSIFLFSVENMRNGKLKELRGEWKHSRFVFGKNKVMQLGLGNSKENEIQDNLYKLSKRLIGQCGLLFTNQPKGEVLQYFETYSAVDYARAGTVAVSTVVLPEGPLPQFSHVMEPYLRGLGMPTKLDRGIVTLRGEHTVCKEGFVLKPNQARILKLLENRMAEFKLTMKCHWSKDGKFRQIKSADEEVVTPRKKKRRKSEGVETVKMETE